jgi:hypothetical protein
VGAVEVEVGLGGSLRAVLLNSQLVGR